MNWEAIGAVGEVLGAIAVLISLLYLASQIRGSRRSDQIIAVAESASAVDAWIGHIARDEKLFDLYRRGMTDYESLSREEKGRFSFLILQFLRSMEALWLQRKLGAMDDQYWTSMLVATEAVVGSPGGMRAFQRYRETLSLDFTDAVQRILEKADPTTR